ncbi:MAG: serine/threonine protein kinase [Candidatus Riflebacteria bacterium]|nr:serine/threonine protein kinase [Candidatus Riflebacteria bacterium]
MDRSGSTTLLRCPGCQQQYVDPDATDVSLLARREAGEETQVSSIRLSDDFRSRFDLERVLGSGAMGMVCCATDRAIGRRVAIKFLLHVEEDDDLQRLLREGKVLAGIRHPNVITIFDLNGLDRHPYLVMEFLEGGTLRARLGRGARDSGEPRMTVREATELAIECLAGLQACHCVGVLHRDVKPENILFDSTGRPKLSDFGLSKLAGAASSLTTTGAVVGTPRYMAPEQFVGETVGFASDIYAMATVLYEMLSGAPPFRAQSLPALVRQQLEEVPGPIQATVEGVPAGLASVLHRALSKQATARPPSAEAFADELRATLAGPETSAAAGAARRPSRAQRRVGVAGDRSSSVRPPSSQLATRVLVRPDTAPRLKTLIGAVALLGLGGLLLARQGVGPSPTPVTRVTPSGVHPTMSRPSRPMTTADVDGTVVRLSRMVESALIDYRQKDGSGAVDASRTFKGHVEGISRLVKEMRSANVDPEAAPFVALYGLARLSRLEWDATLDLYRIERALGSEQAVDSVAGKGVGTISEEWNQLLSKLTPLGVAEATKVRQCAQLLSLAISRGSPRNETERFSATILMMDVYLLGRSVASAFFDKSGRVVVDRIVQDLGASLSRIDGPFRERIDRAIGALWACSLGQGDADQQLNRWVTLAKGIEALTPFTDPTGTFQLRWLAGHVAKSQKLPMDAPAVKSRLVRLPQGVTFQEPPWPH